MIRRASQEQREAFKATEYGQGWCAGMREATRFWASYAVMLAVLAFGTGFMAAWLWA